MVFRFSYYFQDTKDRILNQIKKKTVKKPFLGLFWDVFDQGIAFLPSKLVLFGVVDACRKNLRLVGQKWMS